MQVTLRQGHQFSQQMHHVRGARRALAAVLACAGLTGCAIDAPPAADGGGLALWFAPLTSGACTATSNGTSTVPEAIDRLVVNWTDPSGLPRTASIQRAKLGKGSWEIRPLLVTDKLDIDVWGCSKDKKVVYAGRSNDLRIDEKAETTARVFMTPVGKLSCAGSSGGSATLHMARSLAGATVLGRSEIDQAGKKSVALAAGDVLVAGGIKDWSASKKLGTGSNVTDLYDHRLGQFRKGPDLLAPRILPHVLALAPGKVLVVGGVTTVQLFGQQTLPSPLLAPAQLASAQANPPGEILRLHGAAGEAGGSSKCEADVGVGARFLSSAIHLGSEVLFVGGVGDDGSPLKDATRLGNFQDVAGGGPGLSAPVKLIFERARPALLQFPDGTVIVWGGAASGKASDMGELIAPGATTGEAVQVTGAGLVDNPNLSTVGAVAVALAVSADSVTFLVAGGIPFAAPTNAANAPSYVVTVNRTAKTADMRPVALSAGTLRAGLHAAATRLPGGQILVAGGLVAPASIADVCTTSGECVLDSYVVLQVPADLGGPQLTLTVVATGTLGGPRFGMTALPLPSGALLTGGQSSILPPSDPADVLDNVGAVISVAPGDEAKICK